MDAPRVSRSFLLKTGFGAFLLLLLFQYSRLRASGPQDVLVARHQSAGNSTLGFGALLAVTPNSPPERMSWRKAGMQRAAAYTGLDIQYPVQPSWNDSAVERLTSNSDGQLKSNAALAWLGHLYTLEQASRYKTALVFEDDIDWDVTIRAQTVQAAAAIWRLTQPPDAADAPAADDGEPYGLEWDVLWLGHCGSALPDDEEHLTSFRDPSIAPDIDTSIPRLRDNPEKHRYVYRTGSPVCTFAYAVRQEVALDIIERAAGQAVAFDVWLHFQCERGGLRCYAVNPELFHQHEMPGAHDSIINGQDQGTRVEHRRTKNIWHSARCNSELGGRLNHVITCPV